MKNMVLCCFFMLSIVSCASNGDVSHWQGESLGNLIAEYGPPDTFLKLSDGNKVIEYDKYSSQHLAGNFCSLTFMLDRHNKILGAKTQGNGTNCRIL